MKSYKANLSELNTKRPTSASGFPITIQKQYNFELSKQSLQERPELKISKTLSLSQPDELAAASQYLLKQLEQLEGSEDFQEGFQMDFAQSSTFPEGELILVLNPVVWFDFYLMKHHPESATKIARKYIQDQKKVTLPPIK